jgi:phosphoglucomutase/phosphomannomutase
MAPDAGSADEIKSISSFERLTDDLTQILSVLLDFESPWVWARRIVEDAVKRYNVDVATLWRVDGNVLKLVGGVVMGTTLRPLLSSRQYYLDWEKSKNHPQGITAAVAVLNRATLINSQKELRDRQDRLGHLDDDLYSGIPDGPFNEESGFGCLFAVPLTLDDDLKESAKGRSRTNKDRVAGVFKIERRRKHAGVMPFDETDLANFELVADTLEHLLRRSHHRQQRAREHVSDVLASLNPEDIKQHHKETLRAYAEAFQAIAKIGVSLDVSLEASKSLLRNLERDAPEAMRWINSARQSILDALRPQPVDAQSASSHGALLDFQRPELASPDRAIRDAETVRDQVQALVVSADAQPLNAESTDENGWRVLVDDLIRRAQVGFASRGVSKESKDAALNNLRHWLLGPEFEDYRNQLEWLIKKESWDLLLDSFHRILPFGTGGRRGPVGIGPNRFNPMTLKSSVQGHAKYLLARYPGQELSVVIAYDVRKFSDLRGLYNAELNPLLGKTSRDFALLAAEEYTANFVRVFLPEPDHYLTTPELSFTIRRLGAHGGLNISASHNHPDDNGGKFFGSHGGQEVPPYDGQMAKEVANALVAPPDGPRLVPKLKTMPIDEARAGGFLMEIPPDTHRAYLDVNIAEWRRVAGTQSVAPDKRALVVFTPLHGTGTTSALEVLIQAGFRVETVAQQMDCDGSFPTVPFRAPNPEVPESMHAAVERALGVKADLAIACDPDADRIGVCARRRDGGYQFLNGNEIAVLATKFKLEALQRQNALPRKPLVIKTEVTTELLRKVTDAAGGTIIGDLLVGFKYHVDVLNQLESTGQYQTRHKILKASLQDFVIAVEESHGVLVTAECRDKDAAGAALLLAQLAEVQRSKGLTVVDYLERIYLEYGYHSNIVSSMVMSGAQGLSQIHAVQEGLRARARDDQRAPWLIGGLKVIFPVVDHLDADDPLFGPLADSDSAREARNVLVINLEGGARVIIRPSGTEPKNKAYIEVASPPLGLDAASDALERIKTATDALARAIADDFTKQMLAIIGVYLPDYALRISGLVPLDKRMAFAQEFMPTLESHAQALTANRQRADEVSSWIDQQLRSYGEDARGLVAEAVDAYVANQRRGLATLPAEQRHDRERVLSVIADFFQTKRG